MPKYKIITQEQLDNGKPDGEHSFDIELRAEYLADWFNKIPSMNEDGHEYDDYRSSKMDNETVLIQFILNLFVHQVKLKELRKVLLLNLRNT